MKMGHFVLAVRCAALLAMTFVPVVRAQSPVASEPRLPLKPLRELAFTVDEGTQMSVDISPDGKLLTFDVLGQIFTLPIKGGLAQQLTRGPAFAERPTFSRDGRFILFDSDQSGTIARWRVPVAGGAMAPLLPTDTGLSNEYRRNLESGMQAPHVHYQVRSFIEKTGPRCVSYIEIRDSVSHRRITLPPECRRIFFQDETPRQSAFTPDGHALITAYGGKLRRIDLANATATTIPFTATIRLQIRPLVRFPHRIAEDSLVHARRIEHPRISPDGKQVVFGAFDRLWLMALPTGTPRRLTTLEVGEFEPVWSPEGQYIAFATWPDAWPDTGQQSGAIYRVRVDGTGRPERLTQEGGQYRDLAYTADGQRLVAVRGTEGLHERRFARLEGTGETVGDSPITDAHLVWLAAAGGPITRRPLPPTCAVNDRLSAPARGSDGVLIPDRVHDTTVVVSLVPLAGGGDSAAPLMLPRPVFRLYQSFVVKNRSSLPCEFFLSPTGDRALVRLVHDIYLVDVPPMTQGAAPAIIDLRTTRVRRLTTTHPTEAEFPRWDADGRSFSYAFGRILYRYDVARADSLVQDSIARVGSAMPVTRLAYQPTVIPIDVTLPRDRPRGTIVFRNARLLTMQGNRVIERGDLVVRDRRIVALGATGQVTIPSGAHVIDATGRTIMPGLVDLHNHVFKSDHLHRQRVWQHEANLAFGVLTSRDPQSSRENLTYEDRHAAGLLLGPRFRSTGPGVGIETVPQRPEEMQALIRRYAEVDQVEYIKEYGIRRRDMRQWLVMAAAEHRLNVVSHGSTCGLQHLVQDAVDGYGGIDHVCYRMPVYADVRQLLARTGITLAHLNFRSNGPDVGYFAPLIDTTALTTRWQVPAGGTSPVDDVNRWLGERSASQIAADGGHIGVGGHGEAAGYGTHLFMWALAQGGMPPLEVLRSGTLRGAEALGLDRDLGSLEVGKLADLIVLDANPLEQIQHTLRIRSVLFNGRLYDAATLNELWPRPYTRAPGWWETVRMSP